MKGNETKAKDFLNFVAQNATRLKKNLLKNITYDETYFEDVFSDTVLKVYGSIIKNGTEIKDYEQYFFMSSKWQYILTSNRETKKRNAEIRGLFDDANIDFFEDSEDEEERFAKVSGTLDKIKRLITARFSERDAEIYFSYMQGKAMRKKISYKSVAAQYQITAKDTAYIINSIKEYLTQNEDAVNKLKKEYLE